MWPDSIELGVLGVRLFPGERQRAAVVVEARQRATPQVLAIHITLAEAHALEHGLRGEQTSRSQDFELLGRAVEALGGAVRAARLVQVQPGVVTGRLELRTARRSVSLPVAPVQAMTAAIHLAVPLLADAALFEPPVEQPLGGPIAAFLQTLDLSVLGDDTPRRF